MISVKKLLYKVVTKINSHNSTLSSHTTTLSNHTTSINTINNNIKVARVGTIEGTGSSKSIASGGTWKNLCSITLPAGVWIVFMSVDFDANGTGYRQATLSTANNTAGGNLRTARVHATPTPSDTGIVFSCGVTGGSTYYLNCVQNSGSSLSTAYRYVALRIGTAYA